MTVSTTGTNVVYAANGATSSFAVPFLFMAASHLRVTLRTAAGAETVLALNVQYSVTGAGNPAGGAVVFGTAPASGNAILIERVTPKTQDVMFNDIDAFSPDSIEGLADKLTLALQEQTALAGRALLLPLEGGTPQPVQLPVQAARAGKFLAFDGSGGVVAASGTGADAGLRADLVAGAGAALVGFLLAATGAVARPVSAKLADIVSVRDFGATGVGDNTAAITAADAAAGRAFVPAGIYNTSLASSALRGPFWGAGQIRDAGGNRRAPEFSAVAAPPASVGNWDSPETAFNGDLSGMQRVQEHRITGATTLGQPTTGYFLARETAAEILYGYIGPDTGYNHQLGSNVGRTGAAPWQRQLLHAGNGDGYLHWVTGIATGTRAGSTHWLANPAIALYAGQALAGADGVYLQLLGDLNAYDQGHDAAAQGVTLNLNRTNKVGAKATDWTGVRLQTQGSEAVDAWMAMVGQAVIGIDVTRSNFGTNKAFITMAAGARIYGNAANADTVSLSRYTTVGNAWVSYETSLNGWNIVALGGSVAQFAGDRISFLKPTLRVPQLSSSLPSATGNTGMKATVTDANGTTRRSVLVGGGTDTVEVMAIGGQWIIL